jgi:hypothetical protein
VNFPDYIDVDPSLWWDPAVEVCEQEQFRDFTGVDSLAAFVCSILVFTGVQTLEHFLQRPLFYFPGLVGYRKDISDTPDVENAVEADKAVELEKTGEMAVGSKRCSGVVKGTEDSESTSSGPAEAAIDVGVPAGLEESEHEA